MSPAFGRGQRFDIAQSFRQSRQTPSRARCCRQRRARDENLRDGGRGDRGRGTRSAPLFASERRLLGRRVAERRKMAKRKGAPTSREGMSSQRESEAMVHRPTSEVENAQLLLDKLPPEVWEKILDDLEENDLFPLALSCRFFRQKQKELLARTRQNGPGSDEVHLALKTNLKQKLDKDQPASAEYLRFCSKEEASMDAGQKRDCRGYPVRGGRLSWNIHCLAAFHGYLPLLQQLQAASEGFHSKIFQSAGESSPLLFLHFLLCFGD